MVDTIDTDIKQQKQAGTGDKPADADNNPIASHQAEQGLRGFRELPHNLDLEMALLGAILRNNRVLETLDDEIMPAYFYAHEHKRIFELINGMAQRGQVASPTSLSGVADNDPLLKEAGGSKYLFELAANLASVINARQYASQIRDLHMKRELVLIGEDIVNIAHDLTDLELTGEKQVEIAESRLYTLATTGESARSLHDLDSAVAQALKEVSDAKQRGSKLVGVTTGLRDIDRILGGLHRSDLLILAGRPGMGKTALATNMAFNAAHAWRRAQDDGGADPVEEGAQVLFFSLEMAANQLAGRILSERSRVSSDRMRRGVISDEEIERIGAEAARLAEIPFYIDDTPALSITAMRQRARRLQRQHGLGMIVVDYLQLVNPPPDRQSDNRVQEVSEITRGLKAMARELNVPVLALSQLSRSVESREDNRPMLSDLRESGSIEQDADVVAFVYREEYYLKNRELKQRDNESDEKFNKRFAEFEQKKREANNIAELLIEKQRHGPTGKVKLYFDKDYTRFTDLDTTHNG